MNRVAVMQGRLVPPIGNTIQAFPIETWADEFPRAAAAGIDGIEWIYDAADAATNPLATTAGQDRIAALSRAHGIQVWSCCADYFMSNPIIAARGAERVALEGRLHSLIGWASALGVAHIVLPFVDASAIRMPAHHDVAVEVLTAAAGVAKHAAVELHVETDLNPVEFARLLDRLPHEAVRVNYDAGNSASLGYAPADEFAAYGTRVGSVHLKDRRRGGTTVAPGTGDADFAALFSALAHVNYRGDFTLQVARGAAGSEVAWIASQRAYFAPWLTAHAGATP